MKKLLSVLGLCSLLLVACQTTSEEEAFVELASEDQFVTASSMSDQQSFSYTFDYDPNQAQYLDTRFEGSTGFGPNFMLTGGAELVGYTLPYAELPFADSFTELALMGDHEVFTYEESANNCKLEYGGVMHGDEVLILRVKLCAGNDEAQAKASFKHLMNGLKLEELPGKSEYTL